jgi:hypothetical protein
MGTSVKDITAMVLLNTRPRQLEISELTASYIREDTSISPFVCLTLRGCCLFLVFFHVFGQVSILVEID